jgi:hypothetical protein
MNKNNWLTVVCTAAIILTLIGCTWVLRQSITTFEVPEARDYSRELADIGDVLKDVERNTSSIDQRLMTPEERHQHLQQLLQQMKKPEAPQ